MLRGSTVPLNGPVEPAGYQDPHGQKSNAAVHRPQ